jgi:hypothetical protein
MCGEGYGIVKSIISIIMKEFCVTIRNHWKTLVILKLFFKKIKKIIASFESLHVILYILGAINANHIPIIASEIDPRSYIF